jgi:hypothetical protein
MAINYTTTFTRLGTFIHEINHAVNRQSNQYLGSGVGADNILDEFNDRREWVTGVLPTFTSASNSLKSLASSLSGQLTTYLGYELQNELNSPGSAASSIIPLLIERMKDESQTVLTNTCTVSASAATNVGNGTLHVSALMGDGTTSQGLIPESVRVTCTQTVISNGSEQFEVVGRLKTRPEDGVSDPGSGTGPSLRSVAASSLIDNGALDTYTITNTPDGWTVDAGTVGTNIFETAAQLHAFSKSLDLRSSGISAIRISQPVTLSASRVYNLSVWLKRSGGAWTAGSTFTVKVGGTGWSVNVFSADPSTISSSQFNLSQVFFATPSTIPSDVKVTVEWTSATANSGKSVYVSGCFVASPTVHANVNYIVTRGSTAFVAGDTFTCTTTNSRNGKFQDYFTRFLGYQLPSSATPTISDTLVG